LGPLLRDVSAHITGVDISQAMLAEAIKLTDAQGTKIYNALIHRDLQAYLDDTQPESFDIAAAAGVTSYIGDLSAMMSGVAKVLKSGGLFGFTADTLQGGGDYALDADAGRFRYSEDYLKQQAAAAG